MYKASLGLQITTAPGTIVDGAAGYGLIGISDHVLKLLRGKLSHKLTGPSFKGPVVDHPQYLAVPHLSGPYTGGTSSIGCPHQAFWQVPAIFSHFRFLMSI